MVDLCESNNNSLKHNKELAIKNKFKSLPIVVSTCFWLSENYNKLKEKNYVTKCTCNLAESTIKNSIDLATPILDKFKDKVDVLDSLACNQLDKLEAAFPIIKSNPDTLVNQGKELINNWTIQPAVTKIYNIKNSTEKKCQNFENQTKVLANKILDITEDIMDKNHLVSQKKVNSSNENNKSLIKEDPRSFTAIAQRTKLVGLILYESAKTKLAQNINYPIRMIKSYIYSILKWLDFYKTLKRNFFVRLQDKLYFTKDKIDMYKDYLDLLTKQFTVQDGRSLEHVNSLEERTKIIIRRNVGNMMIIFRILCSKLEPLKPLLEHSRLNTMIRHIVSDIFQILNKSDGSFIDLINNLSVECNEFINRLDELKLKISQTNSSILQWVVPNFDAFGVIDEEDDEFDEQTDTFDFNSAINVAKSLNYLDLETDTDLAASTSRYTLNSYGSRSFSSSHSNRTYHNSISDYSNSISSLGSSNDAVPVPSHNLICSSY